MEQESGEMKVYEIKEVPRNCSTCLYGTGFGCAHADRKKDFLQIALMGKYCPSYWLDQHRFQPIDGKRW